LRAPTYSAGPAASSATCPRSTCADTMKRRTGRSSSTPSIGGSWLISASHCFIRQSLETVSQLHETLESCDISSVKPRRKKTRGRPPRRPSTPGQDDAAVSPSTRDVCSEAVSGSEADNENTQEHNEYFKHDLTLALLVLCSIRQIKTLLTLN
jgi:hypothetical protein